MNRMRIAFIKWILQISKIWTWKKSSLFVTHSTNPPDSYLSLHNSLINWWLFQRILAQKYYFFREWLAVKINSNICWDSDESAKYQNNHYWHFKNIFASFNMQEKCWADNLPMYKASKIINRIMVISLLKLSRSAN